MYNSQEGLNAPDPLSEEIASVVQEQITAFWDQHTSLTDAYTALTGREMAPSHITWVDIEHLIEDKYRELNDLTTRRGR